MITNKVSIVYEVLPRILDGSATAKDHRTYNCNLEGIQDYTDSRLDIFEHKFLVFVCNRSDTHWVSVVVVNPFLVFDQYLAEGKDDHGRHGVLGDEDFVGWCVFNSNGRSNEREQDGFQGTMYTNNKASYGVWLFLNICASYLKAKKKNEGDGRQADSFQLEEPFGPFTESNGTEGFPWFDYDCPSILQQSNSFDCGLAAVANSMAFVKHLKDLKFMKAIWKDQKKSSMKD